MRQTPGSQGYWEDIQFTLDPVPSCDYVVVLNNPPTTVEVKCPSQHVWFITQEPPAELFKEWHVNPGYSSRIFTCDTDRCGSQYTHSHPALPWHVNRTYDSLATCGVPQKTERLSWITSNIQVLAGHRARMRFLERIGQDVEFDLFGRGFKPIQDKWDALAPYRYSLAVENYSNEYYWSEKIADCFLSWTMPIYYGCRRITDYFPAESIIQIDITASDVVEQIESALADDPWSRRLDALAHARELVLNRYQIFPFLVHQIHQHESCAGQYAEPQLVTLTPRSLARRHTNLLADWIKRTRAFAHRRIRGNAGK